MVAVAEGIATNAPMNHPASPFERKSSRNAAERSHSSGISDDEASRFTKVSVSRASSMALSLSRTSKAIGTQLWRESGTIVTDAISGRHGYATLKDLCGKDNIYIPASTLSPIKTLGEGAYAVVSIAEFYGVEDPQKEPYCPIPYPVPQTVAVKALKNDINKSEANVVDFVEEIRVLSKLRHSSITEFIGVGANDTSTPEAQWHTLFLVQEYMDSGTLKTLLLKQMVNMGKPMYSFAQAIEWAVDIAEGIEFLHGFRPMVIHRDLKCDNVMLTTDGKGPGARKKAKIADLGLHALVQENGTSSSRENTNSHRKSRSQRSTSLKAYKKYNQVKGGSDDEESDDEETILYEMTGETGAYCYMAPEVLLGQPYNEKVDVFSFGIILYELFSRRMLVADFMNTNEFDESKNHAYRVAAGFRPPCPSFMPEEMKRLVEKCWAGPPELRLPMVEITKKLKGIRDSGVMAALDESMGGGGGACCTVM